MTIATMARVLLAGPAERREAALASLQALGVMELEPTAAGVRASAAPQPPAGDSARRALRHLKRTPGRRRQRRVDPQFDVADFVAGVVANARHIRALEERREMLAARIADVAHWGDFAFPESPAALGGNRLWFYIVPNRRLALMPKPGEAGVKAWRSVSRTASTSHVVVLAADEPDPAAMPAPRIHVGARRLALLQSDLDELEADLDEARLARQALTSRIDLLARSLDEAADADARAAARAGSWCDGALFVLAGWVAEADLPRLSAMAAAEGLALLARPPAGDEAVPTRLDPPAPFAAGADLVGVYQVPPYRGPAGRGWDPSVPVFLAFALFFAIILSDAGYALLLGVALAAWWRRLGRGRLARLRPLFLAMVLLSLGWGVAAGSWFGAAPPAPFLARLKILDLADFPAMLALSIWIGIGHLGIAMAARAWAERGGPGAFVQLGWLSLLAGAAALWQGVPQSLGLGLMALGALAILAFAGSGSMRSAGGALRRLGSGLVALTGVSRLFADILSYLRLFALGLASASLAMAFNALAADARAAIPGFGMLAAALVLGVGHLLNLALAVVGGTVHGLRLNYIEFGNWAEAGEGRPFRPFRRGGRAMA
ncbi:V-type ATP synthase subunit I [Thermaurantiacus sp.]